jgi:hypothetical protein
MRFQLVPLLICLLAPGCLIVDLGVTNPIVGLSTVAVAPFFNLSSERSVDGRRFAEAYYSELQKTPGFDVVPVGVTEQAIAENQLQMSDPQDVLALARILNVDAVVVGAVSDYSPYYPPRIGMKVSWYTEKDCVFSPGIQVDPTARPPRKCPRLGPACKGECNCNAKQPCEPDCKCKDCAEQPTAVPEQLTLRDRIRQLLKLNTHEEPNVVRGQSNDLPGTDAGTETNETVTDNEDDLVEEEWKSLPPKQPSPATGPKLTGNSQDSPAIVGSSPSDSDSGNSSDRGPESESDLFLLLEVLNKPDAPTSPPVKPNAAQGALDFRLMAAPTGPVPTPTPAPEAADELSPPAHRVAEDAIVLDPPPAPAEPTPNAEIDEPARRRVIPVPFHSSAEPLPEEPESSPPLPTPVDPESRFAEEEPAYPRIPPTPLESTPDSSNDEQVYPLLPPAPLPPEKPFRRIMPDTTTPPIPLDSSIFNSRPVPLTQHEPTEPLMSYTRLFDGIDADLVAALRDYVELSSDRRSGGWEGYLYRSEDFIRFTAHRMIVEMLTLHGGETRRRVVFKVRKVR